MAEQTALTPTNLALLLALHEGPRRDCALMNDVGQLSQGAMRLDPVTLYRSLQSMRVDGLVEEASPTDVGDGAWAHRRVDRRRCYRITPAGRAKAADEARRLATLVEAACRLGALSRPSPPTGLRLG